ncbi:class I SAM-dependent methyltransferase [Flavobacterium sp. FlaQc-48]|uniref:class I SAM-dependent methyltransferase n=1 Tax=Flavobacterium sp. FlaQc-48 TaxID=3374181 RepID=UPI00375834F3
MIKYIASFFKSKQTKIDVLSNEIKKIHALIPQDFGGGCSHEKGLLMSLIISDFELKNTADIGVYRGRSLFPQAIAHKFYSKGIVYGIDPYSNEDALQYDNPSLQKQLDEFIASVDFQGLFNGVTKILNDKKYQNNCQLIRKKSSDAAVYFSNNNISFGLVHIDGNHDTKFVMEDVNNYLPLLQEKSFIVLDDVSWDSVQPAFSLLSKEMEFVDKYVDETNDFAVFGKGLSNEEIDFVRANFKKVKALQ